MLMNHAGLSVLPILVCGLLFPAASVTGQVLFGRETAEIKRLRPAEVFLGNATIMVQVTATDGRAAHLTERLKKVITNGVLGSNRMLREVKTAPQILVECAVTRFHHEEKSEVKRQLFVKEKGRYRIVSFTVEATYKVIRTAGNQTLIGENISLPYKKEFEEGGAVTPPSKSELEDNLLNLVVRSILHQLNNTEETHKVRLMGAGDLDRYSRFAQGGQWGQYIESLMSLPEKKADKDGKNSFEADRNYNIAVAYEAQAYEHMWNDYGRAEQYFDLADTHIRKAQQLDPREKEYVNAQTRMLQGKRYFETIKERFPKVTESPTPATQAGAINQESQQGDRALNTSTPSQPSPSSSGAMINEDVIKMVQNGLSEGLIIGQIRRAKITNFDLSTNGIVRLHNAGVSEKLIQIMQEKQDRKPAAPAPRRKRNPKPFRLEGD